MSNKKPSCLFRMQFLQLKRGAIESVQFCNGHQSSTASQTMRLAMDSRLTHNEMREASEKAHSRRHFSVNRLRTGPVGGLSLSRGWTRDARRWYRTVSIPIRSTSINVNSTTVRPLSACMSHTASQARRIFCLLRRNFRRRLCFMILHVWHDLTCHDDIAFSGRHNRGS